MASTETWPHETDPERCEECDESEDGCICTPPMSQDTIDAMADDAAEMREDQRRCDR